MKRKSFLGMGLLWVLMLSFFSCSEKEAFRTSQQSSEPTQLLNDSVFRGVVSVREGVNKEALAYCDNTKTMIYATGALQRPRIIPGPSLKMDSAYQEENPMSLKLNSLDICDAETGQSINFFDLPEEQQKVFLDLYLLEQAKSLSEKLVEAPQLRKSLRKRNGALTRLIAENNLLKQKVGYEYEEQRVRSDSDENSQKFRNFNYYKEFDLIKEDRSDSDGRYFSSSPLLSLVERVKHAWVKDSRRGDIIVRIPHHNVPWTFINICDKNRLVGHAGIIRKGITYNTDIKADGSTIECFPKEGVCYKRISDWEIAHYVLGVQKVKYKWSWSEFKLEKTASRVDPGALADWAERYYGHEYVEWYEFATAKLAAPERFTCTSLVWWCAKKAYGINVSDWYSPLVTPDGLYTDESTYIRRNVQ
jgi:lipoprotein